MDKELLTALQNVNINIESAEVIMGQYMTYKYVELGLCALIVIAIVGVFAFLLTRD